MDKSIKKILLNAVKQPPETILKIIDTTDTPLNKLRAIKYYCTSVLKDIDKAVETEKI